MYGDNSSKMPLGLAMGLSSNPEAFHNFLKMSDSEQDKIISKARNASSLLEIYNMVNKMALK
ncbi:MAG: hypothetical protein E7622_03490 [Ruminococcaceae bacterium]|nr:hypothetical protein [Oscillospiraceae bacterium]